MKISMGDRAFTRITIRINLILLIFWENMHALSHSLSETVVHLCSIKELS